MFKNIIQQREQQQAPWNKGRPVGRKRPLKRRVSVGEPRL